MALREINANPTLLPDIKIKFEFIDSKRSSAVALKGAIKMVSESFGGEGADVVVGPASSGPSMNAQLVFKTVGIPQMSYSASSPDLSDSSEYPTFFRTSASDAFQSKAVAMFLKKDLGYTNVCIIYSYDSYSSYGAQAFEHAAFDLDIMVHAKPAITENPTIKDTREALNLIKDAPCRVIIAMTQATAGGTITKEAVAQNMMGADSGYLWVLVDAINAVPAAVAYVAEVDRTEIFWEDGIQTIYESKAVVLADAWHGTIGFVPVKPEGTAAHTAFMERYRSQTSTVGTCGASPAALTDACTCATDTDDYENKLFERDHDEDASTAPMCVGFDYADASHVPNSYMYLAYDAVYAFAHAAHKVVEDGYWSEFAGGAIVEALKTMDAFEGVSGTVKFESNGDREIGVDFTISNYRAGEFVAMGNWHNDVGLLWESEVDDMVFATVDGRLPWNVVVPEPVEEDFVCEKGQLLDERDGTCTTLDNSDDGGMDEDDDGDCDDYDDCNDYDDYDDYDEEELGLGGNSTNEEDHDEEEWECKPGEVLDERRGKCAAICGDFRSGLRRLELGDDEPCVAVADSPGDCPDDSNEEGELEFSTFSAGGSRRAMSVTAAVFAVMGAAVFVM